MSNWPIKLYFIIFAKVMIAFHYDTAKTACLLVCMVISHHDYGECTKVSNAQ